MKNLDIKLGLIVMLSFLLLSTVVHKSNYFYVPTTIDDFFMPGSQPGESGDFDSPNQCDNCHGGYDNAVEPAFNWRGSMMSQAMRDPLFDASLTIANQDAIDSGDLCLRCHTPGGWLSGRSEPTDGSALQTIDYEGVQCHVCHKLIDPASTEPIDLAYMNTINNVPTQHGNGMFVVDSDNNTKRGPYDDAEANHPTIHSTFHTKSDLCATCHDVSNPAFSKAPDGTYQPNSLGMAAPDFDKYEMFPVERTYSEWLMSDYNSQTGIPSTAFGGNKANVASCMDCHMPDVTGKGCDKNFAPIRNDLAQHDMTGGNTFVPLLIKDLYGNDVDQAAIDEGIIRARYMLQNAATMNLEVEATMDGYQVEVEIINETGHKLPSGYPEGRRIWINLKAFDIADNLLFESGAYDSSTGTLNLVNTKIYEAKLGMSQNVADIANANGTGTYSAGESFHFALNNMVIKDNRIPPRGFTNANFEAVQAAPVGYSYADGDYSDETYYTVPEDTYRIEVKLFYQTTSKEYIEFLRDENVTDTKGQELYDLWVAFGRSAPELMVEQEFFTDLLDIENAQITDKSIRLYPSPAADEIYLSMPEGRMLQQMILYNVSGQLIRQSKSSPMMVSDISPGLYLMEIITDKGKTTRKILIK
ncbi:MAG: T9SS type A sorting domain-containing protein [Flavobacteriaceae bacterium]|nr:T9SS type A sorting domain-containing protein [Flavobacteriaceae bacterium]